MQNALNFQGYAAPVATALAVVAGLVATDTTTAATVIPWENFQDEWVDSPTAPAGGGGWAYDEILINGRFEAGNLAPWITANTTAGPAWRLASGTAGQFPFGPADNSNFATPWTTGSWPMGTTSSLEQLADLPMDRQGEALIRFEAITSWDRIRFEIDWLAELPGGGHSVVEHVNLGEYGGATGALNYEYESTHLVPISATHVNFRATGLLANGSWIDAGFDNASIVLAVTPVPEPTTVLLLAIAPLALLGRVRR